MDPVSCQKTVSEKEGDETRKRAKSYQKVPKMEYPLRPESGHFSSFFRNGLPFRPEYPKWSPKGKKNDQQLEKVAYKGDNMEPKSSPKAPKIDDKAIKRDVARKRYKFERKQNENSGPSTRPHMQSVHACAVQTQFSVLECGLKYILKKHKNTPKITLKSSKMLPKYIPGHLKKRS